MKFNNPISIITYSDKRYFTGNVYKSLNFKNEKDTLPNYWYIEKNHILSNRINYQKFKLKKKEAQRRAKEATQGIIEAIKWLDDVDAVVVVIDATENPYSQVNITLVGNLMARNVPVLVVANKIDLRKADVKRVEAAFPEYEVVGISAKFGKNIEEFYEAVFRLAKKA
jgi:translation elongation factor EF-4